MANPGLEQIIYKADAGDITISGSDLNPDFSFQIEKIVRDSSRGTQSTTGNKSYDFSFNCYDTSAKSSIEADENNFNPLEIYYLGNTGTADITLSDVNLIVDDFVQTDPTSEDGEYFVAKASGTIPNS